MHLVGISYSEGETLARFTIKIQSEKSVFGVNPETLPMEINDGQFPQRITLDISGYKVPSVLVKLKNSILKHDGFKQVGIFRLASDIKTVLQLRKQLDLGQFEDHPDVHSVANLLKVQ